MSDYIKKEDVLTLIDTGCLISNSNYNKEIKLINELPSADVEPIRHGFWKYICNSSLGLKICECSVCHKRTYGSLTYCANCGAKMDKGIAHNE